MTNRGLAGGDGIALPAGMDQTLLTAAAGLRARLESLDVLGNNLANVSTAGFKADREFSTLFLGDEAEENAAGDFAWLPMVQGSLIDFRQAPLSRTEGALDLALNGPGFFVVVSPQGPLYTRGSAFRRSPQGRLETSEGFAVLGEQGPIDLPPGEIRVSEDGSVWSGDEPVGRLRLVEFASTLGLSKAGLNYFQAAGTTLPVEAVRSSVQQGYLETSNVNPAEAAVRLVWVTRQYEMLARAVNLVANDMNRRAIEEIPRAAG